LRNWETSEGKRSVTQGETRETKMRFWKRQRLWAKKDWVMRYNGRAAILRDFRRDKRHENESDKNFWEWEIRSNKRVKLRNWEQWDIRVEQRLGERQEMRVRGDFESESVSEK